MSTKALLASSRPVTVAGGPGRTNRKLLFRAAAVRARPFDARLTVLSTLLVDGKHSSVGASLHRYHWRRK